MLRSLTAAAVLAFATFNAGQAAEPMPIHPEGDPANLEIIVKACRFAETPLVPVDQGKSYDNEKPMSDKDRAKMYRQLGCIDVPIPMQYITGTMSAAACRGHAGYIASMQFLEQSPGLADRPAVGGWDCIMGDHPAVSPVGQ